MANHYGAVPSNDVNQTRVRVDTAAWVALQVGAVPQNNRRHVQIFPKSVAGGAIGLAFAVGVKTTNPTTRQTQVVFTTPTDNVGDVPIIPGGVIHAEPLGDNVALYGRLINKAGEALGSVDVIVTEYS